MTEIYTNIPYISDLTSPDLVPVLIGFRMRPSVADKDTIVRNRGQIKYEYTLTAIDINNTRAWFSSTGPAVELSAPGVNIYSTLKGGTYGYLSGTSMAAPHATGVVALIMSHNPITNVQTRIRMQTTTTDLGSMGRDNLYGYGLVNTLKAVL